MSSTTQVWYLGGPQGNQFQSASNLSGANAWHVVAVTDLNLDGRPDVIWQDPVSGISQVWYLGGTQGTTLLNAAKVSSANAWKIGQ